jgi:hypothetical protein
MQLLLVKNTNNSEKKVIGKTHNILFSLHLIPLDKFLVNYLANKHKIINLAKGKRPKTQRSFPNVN